MNQHTVKRYEHYLEQNINGYDIIRTLGVGMQGIVALIKRQKTGELFCLKLFHWNNQRELRRLERELHLYGHIKHPNVIEAFSFSRDVDSQYMALRMGYCDSGSLESAIQNGLSTDTRMILFLQLLLGVEALHHTGVVHRDLKPANLLLCSSLCQVPQNALSNKSNIKDSTYWPDLDDLNCHLLKIADFGLSRQIGMEMKNFTPCGTPIYMAPEVLRARAYNVKADVYSVGLVGYYLMKSDHLFKARSIQELQKAQENLILDFTKLNFKYHWMRDSIQMMLSYNQQDRPSILDILTLPELQELLHQLLDKLRGVSNEKTNKQLDIQWKRIQEYQRHKNRACVQVQCENTPEPTNVNQNSPQTTQNMVVQ